MGYEYRVFIDSPEGNTDATHYSDEKLYEGAIFRLNKPGTKIHGKPVIVHRRQPPRFQVPGNRVGAYRRRLAEGRLWAAPPSLGLLAARRSP
jgi:hypothetical protein